jgi:hypothetical protein
MLPAAAAAAVVLLRPLLLLLLLAGWTLGLSWSQFKHSMYEESALLADALL